MAGLDLRRARYHHRMAYPVRVIDDGSHYHAEHPDLPGCTVQDTDMTRLYERLEQARREWILGCVARGEDVPMPNSDGHRVTAEAMLEACTPVG